MNDWLIKLVQIVLEDRKPKKHWIYEREGLGKVDFPSHCSYGPLNEDDPYKWEGMIMGPLDSPYEQGAFFLSIDLPPEYPNKPPTIKFLTKVRIHILSV